MWGINYEFSYVGFSVISYFLPVLGENVFLSTQFSNAVSISPLNMRDRVSQPQKITGTSHFFYLRVLIPKTIKIRKRENILNRKIENIPELNCRCFFLQAMLSCSCHYEILQLCLTLQGSLSIFIL